MTIPFLNGNKNRDQVFAVDLGSRTTKAVLLERKDNQFSLARFVVQDAPIYDKAMPQGLLTEHLRAIMDTIQPKTRQVTLAIGAGDSILRSTEMPLMPVDEMRQMLKLNSKTHLQQDLRDYVFDCYIVPPRAQKPAEPTKAGIPKYKVWVGGTRRELLTTLETSVKAAGLTPSQITLSLLGPVNALEFSQPEAFSKDVVALVDLGFKSSAISILADGELCLSRSVDLGGDRLTAGLAEAMNITYAEAEGIKVGMPQEVEGHLHPLVAPLGRELRASIDFFEHQMEKTVNKVLISGGAARSEFLVQMLHAELGVPCKAWFPTEGMNLSLTPQQMTEIEQVSSVLAVALGSAAMSMN
jgi:type IV pilus assembly protein PilM